VRVTWYTLILLYVWCVHDNKQDIIIYYLFFFVDRRNDKLLETHTHKVEGIPIMTSDTSNFGIYASLAIICGLSFNLLLFTYDIYDSLHTRDLNNRFIVRR
jgi:energy-converting hydrogenase Eha subunit H